MLIHDTRAHCIAILFWLNFLLNETFSVSVWFSTLSRGGNNVCFYQLLSKSKCFIRQTHSLLFYFSFLFHSIIRLIRRPCDTEHNFGVKHCTHKQLLPLSTANVTVCAPSVGRYVRVRVWFACYCRNLCRFWRAFLGQSYFTLCIFATHQCFVFDPLLHFSAFLLLDSNQINFRW